MHGDQGGFNGGDGDLITISGTVKWFNSVKGFGFVSPSGGDADGDVFLHLSCLRQAGYDSVEEGASITCEVAKRPKGLQAVRVLQVDSPQGGAPRPAPARSARPPRSGGGFDNDRFGGGGDRFGGGGYGNQDRGGYGERSFGGDSGTTEPNAASRRLGIELSGFWRPAPWLTVDGAAAWTHARFRDVPADQRYIPNATPFVFGGGVSAAVGGGTTLTLRARHFAGAPLIEDNSHRSAPTTLVNAGAYWERGRVRIGVDVLNLLNSEDNDITYWYASRLPGEPAEGVEDTHIHPVEPRQVRAVVRLVF